MSVIVTDKGFQTDDFECGFVAREEVAANDCDYGIDLASDTAPEELAGLNNAIMIRIDFPSSRQPQEQWQFRANWQAHDYQSRLRG